MSEEPSLSDEYLGKLAPGAGYSPVIPKEEYADVPGGAPKHGVEPGDPDDLRAYRKNRDAARKEYEALVSDDLDEVLDADRDFLAKMYVIAEHFGLDKKFKDLLERAAKLRPDRVAAVANVFEGLSDIYSKMSDASKDYWRVVSSGHWEGDFADSFHGYLGILTDHLDNSDDKSLRAVCMNTAKLMREFERELRTWRKDFANAIRKVKKAADERGQQVNREFLETIDTDPLIAGRQLLDALLLAFDHVDKTGKDQDDLLKKYDMMARFGSSSGFNRDETGFRGLSIKEKWEGRLA